MKRETELKILAWALALGLASGLVSSTSNDDTFEMYLPVKDAVANVYGDQVEIDDKFVKAYLETITEPNPETDYEFKYINNYDVDSVIVTNNEAWEFYEWIPSIEEVQAHIGNSKKMTMNKKSTNN